MKFRVSFVFMGAFLLTSNRARQQLRVGEEFVNSFYFLDSLKGFAVGYPQLFKRNTDGGIFRNSVILDSSVLAGFPRYVVQGSLNFLFSSIIYKFN